MDSLGGFLQRFGAVGSNDQAPEDEEIVERPGALANFVKRFGADAESFWFYDHTVEVRFESKDHKYYLVDPELGNLTLLKNSSTVSHIVDRSHALIPWTAKVTVEKMLRLVPTYNAELDPSKPPVLCLKHMTLEEFTKLALEAKSGHSDKLDDAGEVGKIAHNWLEKYILAIMANDDATVQGLFEKKCPDPRSTNCVDAALAWMKAHNVRWLQTERKVYSKKHQCSGTMDGLALTDSCSDPVCCRTAYKDHLSLIDWKTSNYLYTEYLFQTACYEAFYMEEFPDKKIDDRWVIRLGKEDAEFDPWYLGPEDFQLDFDGFLACLNLRRIVDQIEDRMKDKRTYIRKASKAQRVAQRELKIAAERAAKAAAKAEAKRLKLEEKERIKREAKAERERIRAEKKAAKLNGRTETKAATTEEREVLTVQSESVLPSPTPVLLPENTDRQEPEVTPQERTVHGGDNTQGSTGSVVIQAAPGTPDLEGLIAAAKAYKPTPAEKEEQRRSFAYGNVALHNPDVTREMVDKVADEMKRPAVQYDEAPVVRTFIIPTE